MIGRIQGAHYWKKSTLGMLDRLELEKKITQKMRAIIFKLRAR
jgi:hypothetical protein